MKQINYYLRPESNLFVDAVNLEKDNQLTNKTYMFFNIQSYLIYT